MSEEEEERLEGVKQQPKLLKCIKICLSPTHLEQSMKKPYLFQGDHTHKSPKSSDVSV